VLINEKICENKKKALLLARFIVEENTKNYIFFDPKLQISIIIAKSRLKALIGPLKILSAENESQINKQLMQVIINILCNNSKLLDFKIQFCPKCNIYIQKLLPIKK